MKFGLLICVLCSWVVVSRAGVAWWGMMPQADQPQQDEADQSDGTEVLRMVGALGRELSDMVGQDDAWLTRYGQVADTMEENNKQTEELLTISKTALPIIWNTYVGDMMMDFTGKIKEHGGVASHGYSTRGSTVPPPFNFLLVYPSELTADDTFVMQAVVRTTAEANVGFCAYFAPEEGEELDFDYGDIFFTAHFRWHADGRSKEIAFNDRYNGHWSPSHVLIEENQWPDITVGEKFLISAAKYGPCFFTTIVLGRHMHMSTPMHHPTFKFCPKKTRTVDPRKLWLTVNEDNYGSHEVKVHWVTWFPLSI